MTRAIETNVTKKANGLHDTSYVWMWGTIQASLGRLRMTPRRFHPLILRHSYHCCVSLGIPSAFRSIYPQGQAQVDPDGYVLPASKVASAKAAGEVDGPALRHLGTLIFRLRSKDRHLRPFVSVRESTAGDGAGDGPIQFPIRGSYVSKRNSAKPNHAAGRIPGRRRRPARGWTAMAYGLSACNLDILPRVLLYATADELSGGLNSVLGLSLYGATSARLGPTRAVQTKVLVWQLVCHEGVSTVTLHRNISKTN